MLTEVLLIRERRAAKISQLSFRLSVNAEDIHLGPVVNGEGLTHGPLADQLALGFVHDPGQGDLGRGDAPVGAADLQGGKAAVSVMVAVSSGLTREAKRQKLSHW